MADNTQIYPKGYVYGINPNEENDVRLKDLADVDAKTPADGDALVFNILKNAWEPKKIEGGEPGPGGTSNYNELTNKPSINGVELTGNKTSQDLHITGGSGTDDYNQLQNRPSINGHTLTGNQTAEDLGIETGTDNYTELSNKPSINGHTLTGNKTAEELGIETGTDDYVELTNKPSINGHTLTGNKTAEELGITDTSDYDDLTSRPSINGHILTGNKTSEDLGITSGTDDYEDLINKPTINGAPLEGNLTTNDLALTNSMAVSASSGYYPGGTWQNIPLTVGHLFYVTIYKGNTRIASAYMKRETTSQTEIIVSTTINNNINCEITLNVDILSGNLSVIQAKFIYPRGYDVDTNLPTQQNFRFDIVDRGASAISTASDPIQIVNGNVQLKIDNTLGIDSNGNLSVVGGGGGTGTTNYNDLLNRPQINGHTLTGDQTPADLGITEGTLNYNELNNRPTINGVLLSGNKTAADLGISGGIIPVIAMSKMATLATGIPLGTGKTGLIRIKASFPAVKKNVVSSQEESYTATCTFQGVFDRTDNSKSHIVLRNVDANSPFEWMQLELGTADDTDNIKYVYVTYRADKDHATSSQSADYYNYIPYSGTAFADNFTIIESNITELATLANSAEATSGSYQLSALASVEFPTLYSTVKLVTNRVNLYGIYSLGVITSARPDQIVLAGAYLGNMVYIILTKDNTTGNFSSTVEYIAIGDTASQVTEFDCTFNINHLSILEMPDMDNYYTKSEVYSKIQADNKFAEADNVYTKSDVYTKTQADNKFAKTNDVYTKTQANNKFAEADNVYTKSQADSRFKQDDGSGIIKGTAIFNASVDLTWPSEDVLIHAVDSSNNNYYGTYTGSIVAGVQKMTLISSSESHERVVTITKSTQSNVIDTTLCKVFDTYKVTPPEVHTSADIEITHLEYTTIPDLTNYYTKSEVYSKTESDNKYPLKTNVYTKSQTYSKTEVDELLAQTKTIEATELHENTSATAFKPANDPFVMEPTHTQYYDGTTRYPVFKFYATLYKDTQAPANEFYFELPVGYKLPTVNGTDNVLYIANLNTTMQYANRGFTINKDNNSNGAFGCPDTLVVSKIIDSDLANDQFKIVISNGTAAPAQAMYANVTMAIALEEDF